MYMNTTTIKTDWERSVVYSALQENGISRKAALKNFRSGVREKLISFILEEAGLLIQINSFFRLCDCCPKVVRTARE